MLLIPPIPLPARVFVAIYAALELWLGLTGTQQDVAHFAHLGGLALSATGIWIGTKRLGIKTRRRKLLNRKDQAAQ